MTFSTKRIASSGLLGALLGMGMVAALPAAEARSLAGDFAFTYSSEQLDTAAERRVLEQRLTREATGYCRSELGARTPLASVRSCRAQLVEAVTHVLDNRANGQAGACMTVSMTTGGLRQAICAPIQYAEANLREVL